MEKNKKLWFGFSPKKWNVLDIGLFKISLIAFTLFLVSVWSGFANWAISVNWLWFLLIFIVAAISPIVKGWKK
jgi:hypothetical protein